jgi:hypothetical protein
MYPDIARGVLDSWFDLGLEGRDVIPLEHAPADLDRARRAEEFLVIGMSRR